MVTSRFLFDCKNKFDNFVRTIVYPCDIDICMFVECDSIVEHKSFHVIDIVLAFILNETNLRPSTCINEYSMIQLYFV
jgi:hypothetical protein